MSTEADTCRTNILPKRHSADWDDDSIREQYDLTPGRIVPFSGQHTRKAVRRADYVLFIRQNIPIAVVEAKVDYKNASDGLELQAQVSIRVQFITATPQTTVGQTYAGG